MISRSFRLERGSSLHNMLKRSNSSLLASELVSAEIARVTAYEKLFQSMRLTDEYASSSYGHDHDRRRRRNRSGWSFLTKVFSFKKKGSHDVNPPPQVDMAAEEKKKRSTWLPDPQRRWPVQGWWRNWCITIDSPIPRFCNPITIICKV